MSDLHERLTAAVQRRLELARAASNSTWGGGTPTGEHWRWECGSCDTPIDINPVTMLDEVLACPRCGSFGVGLRSIEAYPSVSGGTLPHLVTSAEEIQPAPALHIADNGPATVIRHCGRDLKVLDRHVPSPAASGKNICWSCSRSGYMIASEWPCDEIRDLAYALGVDIGGDGDG